MTKVENQGELKFTALLEQIEKCVNHKLYYAAIMVCLAIPDIGGAIDSKDGQATKNKYVNWFEKYAVSHYKWGSGNGLTGNECYYLRCSMLHQGKSQHQKLKYKDIVFSKIPQIDSLVNPMFLEKSSVLLIEPKAFCFKMTNAAYDWLEAVHNKDIFKQNTDKFMTLFSLSFPDAQR
jgi:hypothetical protein